MPGTVPFPNGLSRWNVPTGFSPGRKIDATGRRLSPSRETEELWYAINRYGAKRMIVWSAVLAAVGVAKPFIVGEDRGLVVILLALTPALFYGIVCFESYRYSQRLGS